MKKIYFLFMGVFFVTNAFAMADRTPPIYGLPTLYGEYEISADDTHRASNMYGAVTNRPAPIRAGNVQNIAAAKHPVKAKKTQAKKKAIKKVKTATAKKSEQRVATALTIQADNVPNNEPEQQSVTHSIKAKPVIPVASQHAIDIAAYAKYKYDTESFCTQIKHQGKGNLPDGIIMMPGRPDLMSCVSNNKN